MRAEFAGMRAYLEAARALGEPWLHSLNTAHRRLRALVAETEALLAAHQILFEAYPEYNPVLVRPASAIDAFVRATWGTAGGCMSVRLPVCMAAGTWPQADVQPEWRCLAGPPLAHTP